MTAADVRPATTGRGTHHASERLHTLSVSGWALNEGAGSGGWAAMIDENLCRAELSPAERATQTARRKAIYLELHPETGHGKASPAKDDKLSSFASSTADAISKTERTVQRDAERGEKVCEEALIGETCEPPTCSSTFRQGDEAINDGNDPMNLWTARNDRACHHPIEPR